MKINKVNINLYSMYFLITYIINYHQNNRTATSMGLLNIITVRVIGNAIKTVQTIWILHCRRLEMSLSLSLSNLKGIVFLN